MTIKLGLSREGAFEPSDEPLGASAEGMEMTITHWCPESIGDLRGILVNRSCAHSKITCVGPENQVKAAAFLFVAVNTGAGFYDVAKILEDHDCIVERDEPAMQAVCAVVYGEE